MASPAPPVRDDESDSIHDHGALRRRNWKGQCSLVEQTATSDIPAILKKKEDYRTLLRYRGAQAQETLDLLQSILDTTTSDTVWRHVNVALQRLAWRAGLFPNLYALRGVKKRNQEAFASGSFGEVYRGEYEGSEVCIKMLRITQKDRLKVMKFYAREAILWGQLLHPNILPFCGICTIESRPCMVSPWAENGNVVEYLVQYPNANRLVLNKGVIDGLAYLHGLDIVHGDLKGSNVLVDPQGYARLADFGLSSVYDRKVLDWTSQSAAASLGGTPRWQAPELLQDDAQNTKSSDIYALACTLYEIFTGEIPYPDIKPSCKFQVIAQKQQGVLPSQSSRRISAWAEAGLDDDAWAMLVECWYITPEERPNVGTIQARTGDWSSHRTGSLYMDRISARSRARGLPFFFSPRG